MSSYTIEQNHSNDHIMVTRSKSARKRSLDNIPTDIYNGLGLSVLESPIASKMPKSPPPAEIAFERRVAPRLSITPPRECGYISDSEYETPSPAIRYYGSDDEDKCQNMGSFVVKSVNANSTWTTQPWTPTSPASPPPFPNLKPSSPEPIGWKSTPMPPGMPVLSISAVKRYFENKGFKHLE